ncbi:hypothetical protein BDV23DRAFT_190111 [Aspergillus alliaceus]|uniref:STEEP1 domain-containing protein n=1 Tax=Petromyces alliaceus TaxID=209559 RepID=A0A5N7CKZ0_PETAA|nr:hypothetical protein BDV23DRAFT_190111 [Aspergillus alliaceus]
MSTPQPDPQSQIQKEQEQEHEQQHQTPKPRLPVRTHHCRFCNHLLLASTRDIPSLPRRKDPAKDNAIILPLPAPTASHHNDESDDETEADPVTGSGATSTTKLQKHYTILLSTTVPDRKATLVRREDGFEKRVFLRCGRCRVVVGYFLGRVHFPETDEEDRDGDGDRERGEKVVYLLPGALVETERMGDEDVLKGGDAEWRTWSAEV